MVIILNTLFNTREVTVAPKRFECSIRRIRQDGIYRLKIQYRFNTQHLLNFRNDLTICAAIEIFFFCLHRAFHKETGYFFPSYPSLVQLDELYHQTRVVLPSGRSWSFHFSKKKNLQNFGFGGVKVLNFKLTELSTKYLADLSAKHHLRSIYCVK